MESHLITLLHSLCNNVFVFLVRLLFTPFSFFIFCSRIEFSLTNPGYLFLIGRKDLWNKHLIDEEGLLCVCLFPFMCDDRAPCSTRELCFPRHRFYVFLIWCFHSIAVIDRNTPFDTVSNVLCFQVKNVNIVRLFFFALDAKCKAIMHGARIFWCMEQISDNQILGIEISIERVTQGSLSPDFAINDRLQHLVICSESLGNVLHFSLSVSPCILPSFFIHKKKSIVHLM